MPPGENVHVGVCALVDIPAHVPASEGAGGLLMLYRVPRPGLEADGFGTWSLPGGWLDFGESPEEAAVREVWEETGVEVRALERAGYVLNHSERSIVTLFIRCEYVAGTPSVCEPEKCQDVQWLTWEDVRDGRPLFAPLRDYLSEASRGVPHSSSPQLATAEESS